MSKLIVGWTEFKWSVVLIKSSCDPNYLKNMSSMYLLYCRIFSLMLGKIYVSSNFPMNSVAYVGAHLVPILTQLIWTKCSSLNLKLFRVSINVKKADMTFVRFRLFEFFKYELTASTPSWSGMLVY